MFDKFVPDIYEKSIYTIDYKKLKKRGIKCLIFDLDNTIAPTNLKKPNKKIKDLFEELKDMKFKIIIMSNEIKKRIEPFKDILGIVNHQFEQKRKLVLSDGRTFESYYSDIPSNLSFEDATMTIQNYITLKILKLPALETN